MMRAMLCFGTAKVGMPWYGAGSTSRPSPAERAELVREACRLGVKYIDTSSAYGDAEDWVTLNAPPGVTVVTKLAPMLAPLALRYGGQGQVGTVMLHNPPLTLLRDRTFIQEWCDVCASARVIPGASVYDPDEVTAAMDVGLSAVQAPFCWLDRRCGPALRRARNAGLLTFARQPFLQGVLLNAPNPGCDPAAYDAGTFRYMLRAVGKSHGVTPVEACLWFAMGEEVADYVVFGAGSLAHLREVVAAGERMPSSGWEACRWELERRAECRMTITFGSLWRSR